MSAGVTTKELAATIKEGFKYSNLSIESIVSQVIYPAANDYGYSEIHDSEYDAANEGATKTSVVTDPLDHEFWADDDADAICLIAQGVTDPALVGEPVKK